MAFEMGALRDALIEAGATPEHAAAAAEDVASYERLSAIDGRLRVLTWMVGFNIILSFGVLFWRLLTHA
jgi:hypothetical protein